MHVLCLALLAFMDWVFYQCLDGSIYKCSENVKSPGAPFRNLESNAEPPVFGIWRADAKPGRARPGCSAGLSCAVTTTPWNAHISLPFFLSYRMRCRRGRCSCFPGKMGDVEKSKDI
ncbi:hypothetical protein V6N11_005310 [Hibiscus sabdariffa]|uniref:Secreted protein n=1 Tax=Hibiscus sabdariffa TaxID=183260 RepID=A0ABR2RME2_9ROSI